MRADGRLCGGRRGTGRGAVALGAAAAALALVAGCISEDTDVRISSGVVTTMEVRVK